MLGLGCSWTYGMAIASRCAGGFFNGIIGALKTIIAESFTEQEQAQVMGALIKHAPQLQSLRGLLLAGLLGALARMMQGHHVVAFCSVICLHADPFLPLGSHHNRHAVFT
jgi:MFS family permease